MPLGGPYFDDEEERRKRSLLGLAMNDPDPRMVPPDMLARLRAFAQPTPQAADPMVNDPDIDRKAMLLAGRQAVPQRDPWSDVIGKLGAESLTPPGASPKPSVPVVATAAQSVGTPPTLKVDPPAGPHTLTITNGPFTSQVQYGKVPVSKESPYGVRALPTITDPRLPTAAETLPANYNEAEFQQAQAQLARKQQMAARVAETGSVNVPTVREILAMDQPNQVGFAGNVNMAAAHDRQQRMMAQQTAMDQEQQKIDIARTNAATSRQLASGKLDPPDRRRKWFEEREKIFAGNPANQGRSPSLDERKQWERDYDDMEASIARSPNGTGAAAPPAPVERDPHAQRIESLFGKDAMEKYLATVAGAADPSSIIPFLKSVDRTLQGRGQGEMAWPNVDEAAALRDALYVRYGRFGVEKARGSEVSLEANQRLQAMLNNPWIRYNPLLLFGLPNIGINKLFSGSDDNETVRARYLADQLMRPENFGR